MATHRIKGSALQRACATPARTGEVGRVMQGGLPPVAYRNACGRWMSGGRSASEPWASRSIKMEIVMDRKEEARP